MPAVSQQIILRKSEAPTNWIVLYPVNNTFANIRLLQGAPNPSDIIMRDGTAVSYFMGVGVGAITIGAQNVGLAYGRALSIGAGAITLGGINVSLAYGRVLTAQTGSVSIGAKNVGLAFGRGLLIGTGSVVIGGQNVGLVVFPTYKMTVLPGTVRLGGQNVELTRYYKNYESKWYPS